MQVFYIALVRITGGVLKGKRLIYPGSGLRPTKEMTRQAIFNVLGGSVIGARVYDLFAGGGALGIEAISRGAEKAVFVENNKSVLRFLKENVAGLKNVRIIRGDVFKVVPKLEKTEFDIVFADPPYSRGLAKRLVEMVAHNRLVKTGGLLVIEHSQEDLPVAPDGWERIKTKVYGETMVTFFRRTK